MKPEDSSDLNQFFWRQPKALVILKIMTDFGRPVQRKELITITKGDDEKITAYLNILSTMGLVTRVLGRTGWTPTAQGLRFMLPKTKKPSLKTVESVIENGKAPLITSTTTTHQKDSAVVEVLSSKNGFEADNLRFFEEIGITLNPKTEFIANHVDPQVVKAEWRKLERRGKPWIGLLIKILTSQPKPKSKQQLEREERRRYAEEWEA